MMPFLFSRNSNSVEGGNFTPFPKIQKTTVPRDLTIVQKSFPIVSVLFFPQFIGYYYVILLMGMGIPQRRRPSERVLLLLVVCVSLSENRHKFYLCLTLFSPPAKIQVLNVISQQPIYCFSFLYVDHCCIARVSRLCESPSFPFLLSSHHFQGKNIKIWNIIFPIIS